MRVTAEVALQMQLSDLFMLYATFIDEILETKDQPQREQLDRRDESHAKKNNLRKKRKGKKKRKKRMAHDKVTENKQPVGAGGPAAKGRKNEKRKSIETPL